MDEKWESVKSCGRAPRADEITGSFHLYFYPARKHEDKRAWKKICKLTEPDKLGYMSSISPGIMLWGYWKGARTISVHTLHDKKAKVEAALRKANLDHRIYKYNLTKRFRRHKDDEGEWVRNSKSKGKTVKKPLNDEECYTDEESELEDSSDEMDTDTGYESEQSTDVMTSDSEEESEIITENGKYIETMFNEGIIFDIFTEHEMEDYHYVGTECVTKSGKIVRDKWIWKRVRVTSSMKTVTKKPKKRCSGRRLRVKSL